MKLTTKSYYSIKALLDLAMVASRQPTSVRAIAERQQIPGPYLEKLLIDLRQAGLVRSQRGAQGGYRLARSPKRIVLAEILQAVGDTVDPLGSVTQPGETIPPEDWVTRALWQRIAQRIEQVLQETTLEDLYFDARSWEASQHQGTGFIV
jgi:Rrf2 family protein